jgi:prepilin-type N-terminal cleavage/methylation domain-containing protein/prepilin-type processing-associated H-X9-DG protein
MRSLSRTLKPSERFTLIELLVVIAIVAILAGMLLRPSDGPSQGQWYPLHEQRGSSLGWMMFADDNQDRLPATSAGTDTRTPLTSPRTPNAPGAGWMDRVAGPDNTNTTLVTEAQIGGYAGRSVGLFHCPGDKVTVNGRPRVRSNSMNGYVGFETEGITTPGYQTYRKSSEIVSPIPARLWVLIDEHPDSINDGFFVTLMDGWAPRNPQDWRMGNYPASFHGEASGIAFADGHSEIHRCASAGPSAGRQPCPARTT